ncbi:MAG: hypothetical protein PHO63_01015 [Bacilli bacterium]|nr:hypothetical protein [Bacilli bacterium]MDD4808524.1 hypothetical protein [Bacilli bacterium]
MRENIGVKIEPEYYAYTFEEILNFYKIQLLVEHQIINEEESLGLCDLYYDYLDLKHEIEDISVRHSGNKKHNHANFVSLLIKSYEMEEELNQFHLLDTNIGYSELVEKSFISKFDNYKLGKQEDLDGVKVYTLKKNKC